MTIRLPSHHLSVDPSDDWVPDPVTPRTEHHGLYLRSSEFGVYLNVREHVAGLHPFTEDGLRALLREQNWGPAIDEWSASSGNLVIVGGSFEAEGMGAEIVLEVFVTDGRRIANLAGPGPRPIIRALRPAAQRLAATVRFE